MIQICRGRKCGLHPAGFNERLVATSRIKVDNASKEAWAESLRRARLPVAIAAKPSTMITVTIATRDTFSAPVFVILSIDVNASASSPGGFMGLSEKFADYLIR